MQPALAHSSDYGPRAAAGGWGQSQRRIWWRRGVVEAGARWGEQALMVSTAGGSGVSSFGNVVR